ncbi:Arc family DNA-binding protein [Frigidibacter oleivorans]|nr:Arc family DNA-binding protein [Frigidibacter oleivorans]
MTQNFPLRLPPDVKAWLMAQAKLNGSSQNSEVIRAIRAAMAKQEAAA